MKVITVISDGLVKKRYFTNALNSFFDLNEYKINYLSWNENTSKEQFQHHITNIERNGPNIYPLNSEWVDAIKETNYLFVHIAPISRELLNAAKKLELIGLCRGGTENVDLETCKKLGIPVIRSVKNATSTAEFTVGLMIDITRNISKSFEQIKSGKWTKVFFNDGYRLTLSEMTIGIAGLGNIGIKVAQILKAFGCKIIAFHPNITEEKKKEVNLDVEYVDKQTLLEKSDILSLHLRLTPDTKDFISENELKIMRKNSYLINTARAGLINERAIINSLQKREILGAAFDVYWSEPLPPNHPLVKLDNVTLTSHIAGDTDVIERAPLIMLKEVNKYLDGKFTPMLIKDKYMVNTHG